jgi:superfamily II DNA or RNA helicase/HKD family nuclease
MGLKRLGLNNSYSTGQGNNILRDFLVPALKEGKNYYRSVGYFSCSSLIGTSQGLKHIADKQGKIKIITSPNLSQKDIEMINEGYAEREKILNDIILKQINVEVVEHSQNVDILIELIKIGVFDIKIVFGENFSLYHDKVGFIEDELGDIVCFVGSANETLAAYKSNYEKIRLYKSWNDSTSKSMVDEELNDFNQIWNGTHKYLETYDFSDSLKQGLIKVLHESKSSGGDSDKQQNNRVTLRPYQIKAINNWVSNGYRGFYEMATGTGKTFTAIYSMKELFDQEEDIYTIIVAPYKHLIEQWYGDIKEVFPSFKILRVSSDHPKWEEDLRTYINSSLYLNAKNNIIILTTKASYGLNRFRRHVKKLNRKKLLIVDEAHRFYNETLKNDISYDFVLGLSATPYFKDQERTNSLISYFDKIVFKYTLEEAIGKYLVNYRYIPYIVYLNDKEEKLFMQTQAKIASCFRDGRLIKDIDTLGKYIRHRNRILARSQEKQAIITKVVSDISPKDHFIVYCGDGYIDSDDGSEDIRYVDNLTRELYNIGIRAHKFTATENIGERMELIDDFTRGMVDVMVAIKCLDEGVNVPSIKTALLLASNDDSREFIQRRGRILRKHQGKDESEILDVIVLPNNINANKVAEIELRRFYEFARLSLNKEENFTILDSLLQRYGLEMTDILIDNNIDEIWEEENE